MEKTSLPGTVYVLTNLSLQLFIQMYCGEISGTTVHVTSCQCKPYLTVQVETKQGVVTNKNCNFPKREEYNAFSRKVGSFKDISNKYALILYAPILLIYQRCGYAYFLETQHLKRFSIIHSTEYHLSDWSMANA